jgi:hypothetical protein
VHDHFTTLDQLASIRLLDPAVTRRPLVQCSTVLAVPFFNVHTPTPSRTVLPPRGGARLLVMYWSNLGLVLVKYRSNVARVYARTPTDGGVESVKYWSNTGHSCRAIPGIRTPRFDQLNTGQSIEYWSNGAPPARNPWPPKSLDRV